LERCCPTYAHSARFGCARCGLLRLPNRRRARRGWRSGRDPVKGWHCAAWYFLPALVGISSTGNGCASIDPIPPLSPQSFFFSSPVSSRYLAKAYFANSFTILGPIGAGSLHTVWGTANFVLSFLLVLRYIGHDARIAVVYSFIV
jgi:hypothetical protein